jgi:hypothetical protein
MFTNLQSRTFILFEQLDNFDLIFTRLLDNVIIKIILYILSQKSEHYKRARALTHNILHTLT